MEVNKKVKGWDCESKSAKFISTNFHTVLDVDMIGEEVFVTLYIQRKRVQVVYSHLGYAQPCMSCYTDRTFPF